MKLLDWLGGLIIGPKVEEPPPEPSGPMSPEEVEAVEAERSAEGMKVYDWQLACIPNEMWSLLRKGKCLYQKRSIAFDQKNFFFWRFHDHRQIAEVCTEAARAEGWAGVTVHRARFAPATDTLILWRPGTEEEMASQ